MSAIQDYAASNSEEALPVNCAVHEVAYLDQGVAGTGRYTTLVVLISAHVDVTFITPAWTPAKNKSNEVGEHRFTQKKSNSGNVHGFSAVEHHCNLSVVG